METKQIYTFPIFGNQDDPSGNPIGYYRTTQKGLWDKGARRYASWKEYVLKAFYRIYPQKRMGKPFQAPHAMLDARICFKSEVHADPDNIVKGLLDSLFDNDKHVDISTNHSCRNEQGSCHVEIKIYDTEPS